jgi:hypothetical protein
MREIMSEVEVEDPKAMAFRFLKKTAERISGTPEGLTKLRVFIIMNYKFLS